MHQVHLLPSYCCLYPCATCRRPSCHNRRAIQIVLLKHWAYRFALSRLRFYRVLFLRSLRSLRAHSRCGFALLELTSRSNNSLAPIVADPFEQSYAFGALFPLLAERSSANAVAATRAANFVAFNPLAWLPYTVTTTNSCMISLPPSRIVKTATAALRLLSPRFAAP